MLRTVPALVIRCQPIQRAVVVGSEPIHGSGELDLEEGESTVFSIEGFDLGSVWRSVLLRLITFRIRVKP